jgi:adenylate cyclase
MPESRKMMFRIGINLGDLVVEGDRIYGDGVNIAARLEGMADPGGICISRTAYDQIEDKLPLGYEYLGERTVKNIVKPVCAYRVIFEPGEETSTAERHEQRRRRKPGKRVEAPKDKMKRGVRSRIWDHGLFKKHLWFYVGVIGFLFAINVLTWGGVVWFHWPALGWGLLLLLQRINAGKEHGFDDKEKPEIRFRKHLATYLAVIGFLFAINVLTWGGGIWFHWPALGWGLLIFLHWTKRT